jgi:hypothetical protein
MDAAAFLFYLKETPMRIKYFTLIIAFLLLAPVCFAANDATSVPITIDTPASGDVTIASGRVFVKNITVTAYTSDKTVTFIDKKAKVVLVMECPADSSISWPPFTTRDGMEFRDGLYLDDSATDLENSSDFVFIWLR